MGTDFPLDNCCGNIYIGTTFLLPMHRGTGDRNILDEFCIAFCSIVEKHTQYIIVSGFVAISSGRVRATEDIDMILPKLSEQQFVALHDDLLRHGFVCMQGKDGRALYRDYLSDQTSIRYTQDDLPIPEMEVKLAKDALDEYQLQTRQQLPLTGLPIWFSSINMNIAFKEEYLKSDKDIEDAKYLRTIYAEQVSEDEIEKVKQMIRRLRL